MQAPKSDVDFDGNDAIELYYWRKHPNLHGWMESLYYEKGGTADNFNCVNLQLTLHRAIVSNEMDKMQPLQICTRDLVTFHHGQFQGAELFIFKDDWFTLPKNDLVNGLRINAGFFPACNRKHWATTANEDRQEVRCEMLKYCIRSARKSRSVRLCRIELE
jgi:hypothetical protein